MLSLVGERAREKEKQADRQNKSNRQTGTEGGGWKEIMCERQRERESERERERDVTHTKTKDTHTHTHTHTHLYTHTHTHTHTHTVISKLSNQQSTWTLHWGDLTLKTKTRLTGDALSRHSSGSGRDLSSSISVTLLLLPFLSHHISSFSCYPTSSSLFSFSPYLVFIFPRFFFHTSSMFCFFLL